MSTRKCAELDREIIQFYHRRVAWRYLGKHDRVIQDAEHTLALMDFVMRMVGMKSTLPRMSNVERLFFFTARRPALPRRWNANARKRRSTLCARVSID